MHACTHTWRSKRTSIAFFKFFLDFFVFAFLRQGLLFIWSLSIKLGWLISGTHSVNNFCGTGQVERRNMLTLLGGQSRSKLVHISLGQSGGTLWFPPCLVFSESVCSIWIPFPWSPHNREFVTLGGPLAIMASQLVQRSVCLHLPALTLQVCNTTPNFYAGSDGT